MKWGETQNVLSVIIGLNIAYYAFKEIRMPQLTALQRSVDHVAFDISRRMDQLRPAIDSDRELRALYWKALFASWRVSVVKMTVSRIVSGSYQKLDDRLSLSAMIVGLATALLLIASTVKFEDALPLWLFYSIVVVGFFPPLGLIALNYAILRRTRQPLEQIREFALRFYKEVELKLVQRDPAGSFVEQPDDDASQSGDGAA